MRSVVTALIAAGRERRHRDVGVVHIAAGSRVSRVRPAGRRARQTASRTSMASGRRSTRPIGICRRTRRAREW